MTSLTHVTAVFVVLGALVLLACVAIVLSQAPFTAWFAVGALTVYAGVAAVVLMRVSAFHPYPGFGAPNVVTLGRLVLTSLFAGLTLETALLPALISADVMWPFVAVATVILALDALDGFLARRLNLTSLFGARFDMETDALLIFLLSVLAYTLGKAGAWVLMSGLLRYIYLAAGWIWPLLNGPLPPSLRRKAVCVTQSAALMGLLAPTIVPPASNVVAFIALLLLVVSFGQDMMWSVRAR
jgi:phosphatidylglycerophosphate synthase